MCYNLAFLTRKLEKYAERYQDTLPPGYLSSLQTEEMLPEYFFVSGFEHPRLPLITHGKILYSHWGLIPSWTKDETAAMEIRTKTLNAAGETLFEKPSFRQNIIRRRALLGINGFYEWRLLNKTKYPYFITSVSSTIMSLGCLFDTWQNPGTGEILQTFSIITTPASPMMETIHNTKKRMPLILGREQEKAWISPDLTAREVQSMIRPYDDSDLKATTVSMAINHVRNNRNQPASVVPVEYPLLTLFSD